jgi:thiol-disulfide isomerase/thioredoxin
MMHQDITQPDNHEGKQIFSFRDRLVQFIKDDGLTVLIVMSLVAVYALLRTRGDTFETTEAFQTSINGVQPTVIEFFSNNCSICLTSKPKVTQLERELQDYARVLKLNVKDRVSQGLANQWGVQGVPTFIVLDAKGNVIYARAGAPDLQAITQVVHATSDAN